jgi:hypothetical protein
LFVAAFERDVIGFVQYVCSFLLFQL